MNQVHVIGRLVREIEVKELGEGRMVMNNTIAIPMIYKKENGHDTDFIPIVAWNKTAGLLKQYCKKGDLIGVTGKLQSRSYLNKENETVYVVEIVVSSIDFLTSKPKETIKPAPPQEIMQGETQPAAQVTAQTSIQNSEPPFTQTVSQ